MLSVSTVRSVKGAAAYFAADNYYASGDEAAAGEWFGKGAEALGLVGKVDQAQFEALLGGDLPTGGKVGVAERHRAGIDLTFSLPKSWSLLALIGGDKRILAAYRDAVKDALSWAERNAAETRMEVRGRERIVGTGKLVAALFEHDTSRARDPQAHVHAVVANVTQAPDGRWRALHNGKLWQLNTLINAIAMAGFRERVEALGYRPGERLKHGNFEAAGLSRNLLMAFSTRRQQILAKVAELDSRTPAAFAAATLITRPRKAVVPDRGALHAEWRRDAANVGLDCAGIIEAAHEQAAAEPTLRDRVGAAVALVAHRAGDQVSIWRDRLGLAPDNPYLPNAGARLGRRDLAAAHAVASALRHLEQREAAFLKTDVFKAALETGLPVTIHAVERRVDRLLAEGALKPGAGRRGEMVTSEQALATERALLAGVDAGRTEGRVFVSSDATNALATAARSRSGIVLNTGQAAAGRLLITSRDRIIAIQGVAGAGKSSVLAPAADLIRASGAPVIGLAVQNTLVQMLQRDTGIESMTVARFLKKHEALLASNPGRSTLAAARAQLRGAAILVDEASMLSNTEQLKLVRLANLAGVGRLAFVGDARQLGAVDAGKPFSVMQQAGAPTAQMSQNLRARGQAIREAAAAAQIGAIGRAIDALAPFTVEAPGKAAATAAEHWLALSPEDRARTAIYASGRRLRSEVNAAVQQGLVKRGEVGPGTISIRTLDRVSVTAEELRYAHSYKVGMVVQVDRAQPRFGLPRARATVEAVDPLRGVVTLRLSGGAKRVLRPEKLSSGAGPEPLQLYDERTISLLEGDRVRWTANDHDRGLFNADQATVMAIKKAGVSLRTSQGLSVTLRRDDPMLERLDLAYALNAHMAQGLTSDRGIAVMETRDTRLITQQTFLVTVTRLRDRLTLIVDKAGQLERQLIRQPGGKTSALEVMGALRPVEQPIGLFRPVPDRQISIDTGKSKPFDIGI